MEIKEKKRNIKYNCQTFLLLFHKADKINNSSIVYNYITLKTDM